LTYRASIQDLLSVTYDKRVNLAPLIEGEEKSIVLDENDPYYVQLRHLFLGDVGPLIQKFIDENPAAAAHYGRTTAVTTNDIKEQVYAVVDANRIIDHRILFFALVSIYQNNNLEIVADFEQVFSQFMLVVGH
jgi:hypothetical protein